MIQTEKFLDRRRFGLAASAARPAFPCPDFSRLYPHVSSGGIFRRKESGSSFLSAGMILGGSYPVLAVAGKKELKHPRVLNLGFRQDMPALYTAADATILASKYEAFGLVGPESISCGTPVLFADTIGATEVLSEPGCYRFKRNADDLAALLGKMEKRFHAGSLRVDTPSACIHYPYVFDDYLDELIRLIER